MWGVNTMQMKLYNVPESRGHLTKTLGTATTFTGAVRGEIDMVSPIVTVAATIAGAFNYAYIDDFECYYWVREISVERTGLSVVQLKRDPTMTFYSGILSCPAIAGRNSQKWSMWQGDNRFALLQQKNIATKWLGSIGESDAIIFGYVE